jgi:hypothetical protein
MAANFLLDAHVPAHSRSARRRRDRGRSVGDDAIPLAVDVLVTDAVELLRPLAAPKHITLIADATPSLPLVVADRDRVLRS